MWSDILKIGEKAGKKYFDKRKQDIERKEKIKELEEGAMILDDIRFQTRTYDKVIPIVFGELIIAGNVLWLSEIRTVLKSSYESSNDSRFFNDFLNGLNFIQDLFNIPQEEEKEKLSLEYYIDFAIGICEGRVDELLGVYINGEAVDVSDYNFRFYRGDENQMPDEAILKEKGEGNVPAFKGLCYCVFENFNLTSFGKSMPTFEFFIRRNNFAKGEESVTARVKKNLRGVNLMPGSGEFVYETVPNFTYNGVFYNDENLVDGKVKHSNMNTFYKKADCLVALDLLKEDLPNLEWVSLVVTWFADSLDISKAKVFPAVEFNDLKTVSKPVFWECAGKNRWKVRQVSRRSDGSLNYGGTVCDLSVVSILKELRSRGYKIVFYPMIFIDLEEKPWRGRMTGEASAVSNFFNKAEGYNEFIMHYARLTKNLCDVFVIGSEMKGLTSISDFSGNFPAVLEFEKLAGMVRGANSAKLTYAADWSEYHSHNGVYNMDSLWASPNIDFIGIDAYFPLTDTLNRPKIQEIKDGWTSGEGYDYYLKNGEKIFYENARFSWKNMRFFLENEHFNVDGTKTKFIPKSKKIWFTEFGFPSVDLCTNQPNVFYDPTSSESFLPKFSKGIVDFEAQKEALVGTFEFLNENKDIIENAFVWCYDLRPYPFFPKRKDVWADGDLWQKGHWLNGKLGSSTFDEIVRELSVKSGIYENELTFHDCNDVVEGLCINKDLPFKDYIKMLCEIYFVKMVSFEAGLKFRSLEKSNFERDFTLDSETILTGKNKQTSILFENEYLASKIPSKIIFSFIDKTNRYEISNTSFEFQVHYNVLSDRIQINVPIVFSKERAFQVAQNLLKQKRLESLKRNFVLPFSYNFLNSGDVITIDNEKIFLESIKFDENFNLALEGVLMVKFEPFISKIEEINEMLINNFSFEESHFSALELPNLVSSESETSAVQIYFFGKNIKPNTKVYYGQKGFPEIYFLGNLFKEQVKGKVISGALLGNVVPEILDTASYIEVFIENSGKGLNLNFGTAIIGGEICDFLHVTVKGGGVFGISNFVRKKFNGLQVKGFARDDFLLISENVHKFSMPSYIKNFSFFALEGLKGEKKEIPFEGNEGFEVGYYISSKGQKNVPEGVLLYWSFSEISDFRFFEKPLWKNLDVEISLKGCDLGFTVKGEKFLVTNEMQMNIFGSLQNFLDFEVKIL
jgi:hypothetical protein